MGGEDSSGLTADMSAEGNEDRPRTVEPQQFGTVFSGEMIFDRSPLYAVLFSVEGDIDSPYSPIVTSIPLDSSDITVPHGLDREVAIALPGLWYCVHLPNTFAQLVDIPIMTLKGSQALHLDHQILLVPIQAFNKDHLPAWPEWVTPALVVCPDNLIDEAAAKSNLMGFPLPAVCYSQLSTESLAEHWRAIHSHFVASTPYLGRPPILTDRLDLAPTDLPRRWLARQMTSDSTVTAPSTESQDDIARRAIYDQLVLATLSRLESENTSPADAEERFPEARDEEWPRFRYPLVLALPGVAPAYTREVYSGSLRSAIQPLTTVDDSDVWSPTISGRPDHLIERSSIEFAVTHQTLARSGVGLMLSSVPPEAFVVLAQLERHFVDGPNGPTIWRLLNRLDRATEPLWTSALKDTLPHASMLTAFSNFPIGLLKYPGDTTPLVSCLPIAYRPLLPLTRAIQVELAHVPAIDLTSHIRVLVAECIPSSDPVGRASREGWKFVKDMLQDIAASITLEQVEATSIDALRSAITDNKPQILVISAHGVYRRERNVAGLQVGKELYLGPEIDSLPPVVILSACHVAPRGAGSVSITDLLLREGAVAVLGAQVPVDVIHNSQLMMRLFLYMAEVLSGREPYSNLLDAWHHVQRSNAINDVLTGSKQLMTWGQANGPSGLPVLAEFMQLRSPGRLRGGHVYQDTEAILGEIADDQGKGPQVRNWFRSPGYVPESLFYVFAGRPERIYLRSLRDLTRHVAAPK